MTEQEMRDALVPTPKSKEELIEYIDSLITQEHDYGTCVYAMSMAAVASFNYVASVLGVTGFQASCADLDIIRRTRNINGPFSIVDYAHALYPQYANKFDVKAIHQESADWLKIEAEKLLSEKSDYTHPEVVKHWKSIADGNLPFGFYVEAS